MVKAFEASGEQVPTARWIGEVYRIEEDYFTGVIRDDFVTAADERVVQIPLNNILRSERPRIVPSALFHCDVILSDDTVNVRAIEFISQLPLNLRH